MPEINTYTFEDADGVNQEWETMDYEEAKKWALEHEMKILLNTYEWTDSELLEDYTNPKPDQDTLNNNAVISERMSRISSFYELTVEGRLVSNGTFSSVEDALDFLSKWMEKEGFFPDIYYVNYRGNVDQIGIDGTVFRSWV